MNICVVIAGVVSPTSTQPWSLRCVAPDLFDDDLPRKLSPFDEAALETALKIRDGDSSVQISALVIGGPKSEALVRDVAAFCPNAIAHLRVPVFSLWNPRATSLYIIHAATTFSHDHQLFLLGRELGDFAGGEVGPFLSQLLKGNFFGLAQDVKFTDAQIIATRSQSRFHERISMTTPAVISVTNAAGNRLRYPLMKNVIAAKRASFRIIEPCPLETNDGAKLISASLRSQNTRPKNGVRILEGSVETKVSELAAYIRRVHA